jgi:heptosyltransferase-1
MKILIIKPSSLGDVIHALPFLHALKKSFPDSQIDWVISSNLKGIIEDNPLINNLIILNKDSWKSIKKLPSTLSELSSLRKTLKSRRYDMVIDLQGLLRSGLIAFSTPTTIKVGFADAREGSSFFYDKKVKVSKNLHAVDKCLEVAKSVGARVNKACFPIHINSETKKSAKALVENMKDYIVIVPSARWTSKRWPPEKFALLISKLSSPCIIVGSKGDSRIAGKILKHLSGTTNQVGVSSRAKATAKTAGAQSPGVIDLCGKTDLKELTAVIAGAKAVISNDSGPMHIAAALGKPVIALFGPTDPEKTGPYGWQGSNTLKVLRAKVPCRPCRKRACNELICMDNIQVRAVLNSLKTFL